MSFFGEKMGEHEEPPSHPDELLHQLCIQLSCRGSPPVLPFLQLQNSGEVFPGFCWDSWRDLWEGGKCWMGSGKEMCISSRMPGHRALPPSSDLGFPGGSGRAAGPRRSWGCSAGDTDPTCLLCLGHAEGPMQTLLERMK